MTRIATQVLNLPDDQSALLRLETYYPALALFNDLYTQQGKVLIIYNVGFQGLLFLVEITFSSEQ